MPATTTITSFHGPAAATETNITSILARYKRADNDAADANNPIVRPVAGFAYSWRKSTKLNIIVSPDGAISNLRWYTSGSALGTGRKLWAKTNASYTQGAVGDESAKLSASTDASTYTSGAALTVNAGTVISNPNTGYGTQDYVETQYEIDNTASVGKGTARSGVYRWDES